MSYTFADHLLVRMPFKNPEDFSREDQYFLSDHQFRAALLLASPGFYTVVRKHGFEAKELATKEALTLRKYINRYCYRPTPFGLFAFVSLAKWDSTIKLERPTNFTTILRINQVYQNRVAAKYLEVADRADLLFEINPFLYKSLNEYRFLRNSLDADMQRRAYQLQSIAYSKMLKDLIAYGNNGKSVSQFAEFICRAAHCNADEAREYAEFLIDEQLLLPVDRVNITGGDYLCRLVTSMKSFWSGLNTGPIFDVSGIPNEEQLSSHSQSLSQKFPTPNSESMWSAVLHGGRSGTLDVSLQNHLRDAIYVLDILSQEDQFTLMARFARSFETHFENQRLPLLAALDPETGIGYQQPTMETGNPLLETVQIDSIAIKDQMMCWSPVHEFLLELWHAENKNSSKVLTIEQDALDKFSPISNEFTTLGLGVLFRLIGDNIYLEGAGGANAVSLIGRFTIGSEDIYRAAIEMARHVEHQNPDIIFAELLQVADPKTDNINRREAIWAYELPITASSTLSKENQLSLSDLYIQVEEQKVMLYSEKHGKRVIPMLSSAYNHNLNQLPLFRFLADLPYQYGKTNLSFDLRRYFPNLSHYPRVIYKSVILGLATWIVKREQLQALFNADTQVSVANFKSLANSIKLVSFFSLTEGDQQIVFNSSKDADILFFIRCAANKKEVVLKEFLEQKEIRQFNGFVLPQGPLSLPAVRVSKSDQLQFKRKFIPGTEWLYLKIYAPRIGASRTLLQINPILRKTYSHGKVIQWFFIRYEDHASHIRIRLKVDPRDIGEILIDFKTRFEDSVQRHVIREYQLDTYSRELERYEVIGIEKAETAFWKSSELILQFISRHKYDLPATGFLFALTSLKAILNALVSGIDQQILFCQRVYMGLMPEFTGVKVKQNMDQKYRELSAIITKALRTPDVTLMSGSVKAAKAFIKNLDDIGASLTSDPESRIKLLQSLIHMHLNRIFTDDSRKQEMLIYYMLYKYLRSDQGRLKNLA